MEKSIILQNVKTNELGKFINFLTPLNSNSTIYFKLNNKTLFTDSHDESGTIVKSINLDIDSICDSIDNFSEEILVTFYDGKKLKKALDLICTTSSNVNLEIKFEDVGLETFAKSFRFYSKKANIPIVTADNSIFNFANVPASAIDKVKNTTNADCKFKILPNDLKQVSDICSFNNSKYVTIKINDGVITIGNETLNYDETSLILESEIEDSTLQSEQSYIIDKKIFDMVDANSYYVYPVSNDNKIVFKSTDDVSMIVLTLYANENN